MSVMQMTKTTLGAIALVCALSTGALADSAPPDPASVAVDAESLKKFLEDQPKTAHLVASRPKPEESST